MKPTFKLIPDFILPSLENSTYGNHLKWEDRIKGYFKVSRIHQNSEHWSDDCIAVYKAWSLKKSLWKTDDPKRVTRAKHRLITALRRNPVIEVLKKEPAYYRFHLREPDQSGKQEVNSSGMDKKGSKRLKENNLTGRVMNNSDNDGEELAGKETTEQFKCSESKESGLLTLDIIELDRTCLSPFEMNEFSLERDYSPYENSWSTGKCCCNVLLDNSLLSDEKCIWHGASA